MLSVEFGFGLVVAALPRQLLRTDAPRSRPANPATSPPRHPTITPGLQKRIAESSNPPKDEGPKPEYLKSTVASQRTAEQAKKRQVSGYTNGWGRIICTVPTLVHGYNPGATGYCSWYLLLVFGPIVTKHT